MKISAQICEKCYCAHPSGKPCPHCREEKKVNLINILESNTKVLMLLRDYGDLPESLIRALDVQIVLNDVTVEVLKVRGES